MILPLDEMVRDACLVEKLLRDAELPPWPVNSPMTSPVADVCIHVKALAAEVERLQGLCNRAIAAYDGTDDIYDVIKCMKGS